MGGAFREFTHRHEFREVPRGTEMVDEFRYISLSILGMLADKLFLERSMRAFLKGRARALKETAESYDPRLG